jgi:hypothetical protein
VIIYISINLSILKLCVVIFTVSHICTRLDVFDGVRFHTRVREDSATRLIKLRYRLRNKLKMRFSGLVKMKHVKYRKRRRME